ncbi:MAG: serine hydrolase [bacterium]|nr:serine hydrolase [bacterium]
MRRHLSMLVFFLIVLLLTSCTGGKKFEMPEIQKNDFEQASKSLDEYISGKMKSQKVIGFSIAVVSGDKVIFMKGYGYADKENKIPVTEKTLFRMGSISKLFTATSVMQLEEQGKIDIDKPLNTYIKEFSIKTRYENSDPITPRNIMTHHSGLPSDRLKDMMAMSPISFENLVIELQNEYTAFPPNMIFSYSNHAISLLGRLVEVVSQEDFISYTDKNLFKKMEMENSGFKLNGDMEKLYAKGYINGEPVKQYLTYAVPAGLLYSNAEDMSKFIITILNKGSYKDNSVIKPETLEKMWTKQNEGIELDLGYEMGLGWFFDRSMEEYAGLIYMHDGAWDDFRANLLILPEHELGVVTMTNSPEGTSLVYSAASTALKLFLQAKEGIKEPEKPEELPKTTSKIFNNEEIKDLAGYYAIHPSMGALKIEEINGKLFIALGKIKIELKQNETGYFDLNLVVMKIFKKKLPSNQAFKFIEIQGRTGIIQKAGKQEILIALKIDPPAPISEKWKGRIGKYEIINLAEDEGILNDIQGMLSIIEKDGYLMLGGMQPLKILNDNEAITAGLGRNKGDTLKVIQKNGEEIIKFTGYELRKLQ